MQKFILIACCVLQMVTSLSFQAAVPAGYTGYQMGTAKGGSCCSSKKIFTIASSDMAWCKKETSCKMDVNQCVDMCKRTPRCQGFAFGPSGLSNEPTCYLLHKMLLDPICHTTNPHKDGRGNTWFIKLEQDTSADDVMKAAIPSGYTGYKADYSKGRRDCYSSHGTSVPARDLQACASDCNSTSECQGVRFGLYRGPDSLQKYECSRLTKMELHPVCYTTNPEEYVTLGSAEAYFVKLGQVAKTPVMKATQAATLPAGYTGYSLVSPDCETPSLRGRYPIDPIEKHSCQVQCQVQCNELQHCKGFAFVGSWCYIFDRMNRQQNCYTTNPKEYVSWKGKTYLVKLGSDSHQLVKDADETGEGYCNNNEVKVSSAAAKCEYCIGEKCRLHCLQSHFHLQAAAHYLREKISAAGLYQQFRAKASAEDIRLKSSTKKYEYHKRKADEWNVAARDQHALDLALKGKKKTENALDAARKAEADAKTKSDKSEALRQEQAALKDKAQAAHSVATAALKVAQDSRQRQQDAWNTHRKAAETAKKAMDNLDVKIRRLQEEVSTHERKRQEHAAAEARHTRERDTHRATHASAAAESNQRRNEHTTVESDHAALRAKAKASHDKAKGKL